MIPLVASQSFTSIPVTLSTSKAVIQASIFGGKNHGMIRDDLYQWDNWDNNIGNIWSYGISQWDNKNNNSNNNIIEVLYYKKSLG